MDLPYLIYAPGTPEAKTHQLKFGVNTIGRGMDNSIVLLDESLSRQHAEITLAQDGVTITDRNSLNGTFVNNSRINHSKLKHGDSIYFGKVICQFVEGIAHPKAQLFQNSTDSEISILKQVSPEQTRITVPNSLSSVTTDISILKLSQQDASQRAMAKLEILLQVSKEFSSPEEPEKLLEKILNLLFEIMHVDRAVILLVNELTRQLEQKAFKLRPGIQEMGQLYSKKITNFVRNKGRAILSDDACIDQRLRNSESVMIQGIHGAMCAPLKPRESVIGVLYVDNLSLSHVYSGEDLEFLTCLTNQAAIAIDNSQLYQQIQAEAVMRNKLERFFPEAVSRKLREEGNLGIVDREVTALFCDISQFTEMSSQMAPRQIIEMLNEYFQVMVEEIVFAYEGTLEKYIGDALFAVWGAPYQQADDPERAIRAAIAMQWAVRRLNHKWSQQGRRTISIHIGLNTGKVAAGNIGSEKLIQYAAIGDTTNVTSRICGVAKAGEILISQGTFAKLRDRTLPLEKIPPVKVKGKEEPLQLYRLRWEEVTSNE
ncbi:MAG: FHA domain-containing protein [Symploca sp. SIO1B1]|nr:FHA domain-containing protein [Symploca sp. SIO1A3]NER96431.1 FHA domain-containing protein [Symploca sp. SIO1B1]